MQRGFLSRTTLRNVRPFETSHAFRDQSRRMRPRTARFQAMLARVGSALVVLASTLLASLPIAA